MTGAKFIGSPISAWPAEPERTGGTPPGNAAAARSALLAKRLLPLAPEDLPAGATPQALFPALTDSPATQPGRIAFQTDRSSTFDIYQQNADGSGTATPLVAGPASQLTPAWSPDGRQLAFVSDQDGDFDIYLRREDGQVRNLTANSADDAHPAWSPAGDRIYFTSDRGGVDFQIYSMRPDGSDVRQVGSSPGNNAMAPSISPNGQRIAFMRASVLDPLCQWNWDIWVMNGDGSNPQPLTNHLSADLYPTWTPDGSAVVFAGCHNFLDFDLYAKDVTTGVQQRLNNWFLSNEWGATYATSGGYLAFNSDIEGNVEIYTVPATGGTAANLTRNPASDFSPSWTDQTPVVTYQASGQVVDVDGQGVPDVTISDSLGHSTLTDSSGQFTLQGLPAGRHTLTPAKTGFTFSPRFVQVTVPPDAGGLRFTGYDKPPLVFVHGFQGINPSFGCSGYDPDKTFKQMDNLLGASGYYTAFARLETSPCGTPSFADNVPNLTSAINQAITDTGQSKVILITHSMGGLVSRQYLESSQYQRRNDVVDLFTFGTPHHGMPSDVLMLLLGHLSPDGLSFLCQTYQPAVCEFSITGMALFNLLHPNRADGVAYHLISGDAPLATVDFPSKILSLIMLGPDDGAVPTASGTGRWLSGIYERWTTQEVHGTGSGRHSYFKWKDVPTGETASYNQCLEPILVRGAPTCQPIAPPAESNQHPTPATSSWQGPPAITPIQYGSLLPAATAAQSITVDSGQVIFLTQWTTGTLEVSLVDPSGLVIDPIYASSHPEQVTHESDTGWATYEFPAAAAGLWQVQLNGTDLPPAGASYSTVALMKSDLELRAGSDQPWYRPGASAVLTASLSTPVAGATLSAQVFLADGSSSRVNLTPAGAGQYQGSLTVPAVPGYVEARLGATGRAAGGDAFERSTSILFQISPSTASLNGSYGETPLPRWPGVPVYSALVVDAGVDVIAPGFYSLAADLVDHAGNRVAHALASQALSPGSRSLALRFSGSDIYDSHRDGPYTLTNLVLVDQSGAALVIQEAEAVYVTGYYAARDFRAGDLFLPLVGRN